MSNTLTKNKGIAAFIAILIVVVIPFTFYIYFEIMKHTRGVDIDYPERVNTEESLPAFSLPSHTGDTITQADATGKMTIVDFFYTNCTTDTCNFKLEQMKRVQNYLLTHNLLESQFMMLSHTIAREDSMAALQAFAKEHGVHGSIWHLLGGDQDKIRDLAADFYKLNVQEVVTDSTNKQYYHSYRMVLLDKEGYIRGYYEGTDSNDVKEMLKDIVYLDVHYRNTGGKKKTDGDNATE